MGNLMKMVKDKMMPRPPSGGAMSAGAMSAGAMSGGAISGGKKSASKLAKHLA